MNIAEWIATMHKQNLNGRETDDELFELGIKCALEEMTEFVKKRIEELQNFKLKLNKSNVQVNDWLDIPDFKIAELTNFIDNFIKNETHITNKK